MIPANTDKVLDQEESMRRAAAIGAEGFSRAVSYIHAHLGERLSVGDIAKVAGLEGTRLARQFKKQTGVAPRHYLTDARFELAKALIRGSGKTLTQIAAEAGFTDQSHMTNTFRRRTGMTPRDFRKS